MDLTILGCVDVIHTILLSLIHLDVVDATAVIFQAMDAVVVAVVSVLQTGLPLS